MSVEITDIRPRKTEVYTKSYLHEASVDCLILSIECESVPLLALTNVSLIDISFFFKSLSRPKILSLKQGQVVNILFV